MKKITTQNILSLILLLLILLINSYSQDKYNRRESIVNLFHLIEDGIANGNVGDFSDQFNRKLFLSLDGDKTGYFSNNQAYYILKNYFKERRPLKCNVFSINSTIETPYANGEISSLYKGKNIKTQLFITLIKSKTEWKISQITIN